MVDKVEQLEMLNENPTTQTGPVTCLGMTFENDEARRAYFTEELRKKLPELRKIEGFPIGEDEDILALSDPPYYTACPNPWIEDFVKEWEISKPEKPDNYQYRREPFTADVSEGKNDPIYNAHSYHTKVPHKAIMRYILHYTEPGDIVFDGFCGTGMTGVAAQLCGDRHVIEELGYRILDDGTILRSEIDKDGKTNWVPFSKLGERYTVLNDLSPAATFIAYNYNIPIKRQVFEQEARSILSKVVKEFEWMYQTRHTDGQIGRINYTVWSDVFICPECTNEIVFWEVAVDTKLEKVKDEFLCPTCAAKLTKQSMERAWITSMDHKSGGISRHVKQIPVLINYAIYGKRFEKKPDEFDFELLEKIDNYDIPYWFPQSRLIEGKETRRNDQYGITHVHHFFYKRVLAILSAFSHISRKQLNRAMWLLTAVTEGASKLNRERPFGLPSKLSGTLYVSSMIREVNVIDFISRKISKYEAKALGNHSIVSCASSTRINVPDQSIDYLFLDPPFGSNLNYSELNSLWESWLKIITDNKAEAIENSVQGKGLNEYRQLMTLCFKEAYRVLKPGRWMTVEFSNTKSAVWNSIQTALTDAGFIIANVSALDKKQGSFKAVTTTTAVKQDLVISAYKPSNEMKSEIIKKQATDESAWTFVRNHLEQLPVHIGQRGSSELIVERTPRVLFDRMVSYHVQNGLAVPLSSAEFQAGIEQRFPMRDGMAFLETQVAEYDKKRIQAKDFVQLSLFVSDENSAIEWLRQQLLKKPQTRQDLHPNFMKEIQHIAKHEMLPELDVLLEQNFLMYDGEGEVPSQIHTYLSSDYKDLRNLPKNDPKLIEKAKNRWYVPDPNKQADLEKLREKSLLREFNQYVEELSNNKKKLKQFRTEAIRVGFYKAWTEKNYQIIVDIGNRLPESILQEDEKLLRYYDNAQTKLGL
ncbi:DNA methylase [Cohnella xylanilytica]|uniref:DNA methyltransferase n=1 Tax=Cohnella xylanilytica TaxID=557555 RepID=UPI001B2B4F12|nr:DNA methyltransferase [Cohnella xylanilytica]GIO15805.1 DNA methylase [Cohnella xylanilytica]